MLYENASSVDLKIKIPLYKNKPTFVQSLRTNFSIVFRTIFKSLVCVLDAG